MAHCQHLMHSCMAELGQEQKDWHYTHSTDTNESSGQALMIGCELRPHVLSIHNHIC